MLDLLRLRLKLGHATLPDPATAKLPVQFRGRPVLDPGSCKTDCSSCVSYCPTNAVTSSPLGLDLGACVFCGACEEACPEKAISFTNDPKLAVTDRSALYLSGNDARLAQALRAETRRLFGRSLKLRQVSAGGCNGCEAELVALGNVIFDLGRYGVQFVASPRHADGIVVTGPVTVNMRQALLDTWEATPAPRLVIAIGACAISGGAFAGSPVTCGIPAECPVDLLVPGCPPHPLTVLDGILRLLGRLRG